MIKLSSSELDSFFYGTILGDSYFHNNSYICKQISSDLMEFKMDVVKKYVPYKTMTFREIDAYVDKNNVNHQKCYVLYVSGSRYLQKMYERMYSDGKLFYPSGLIKRMRPIGFAVWYADDGSTILVQKNETTGGAKSRRIQICTDYFSLEEHEAMQRDFSAIGYPTKIIDRKRRGQHRMQIMTKEGQSFIEMIEPYFKHFPSLSYKLDMGYRGESLKNRLYVSEEYYNLYNRISAHPSFIDRMSGR